VKPAWFDYHAPRRLDEALHLLAEAGADGRVLAGGQSLMPMLNLRILSPAVLVDINRIDSLTSLDAGDNALRVGALVRHADLLRSADVREGWPLLWEATTQVAHIAIRNRGTVCGSVSHNDPAAEHPSVLVTMGGSVVIASRGGCRELPADEFFTGMLSNALEPGEMVVELRYPRQPASTGTAFVEFARRLGDFAIAGAAAMLTMRAGVCERARLTIVGMGEGPFRAREAESRSARRNRRTLLRTQRRRSSPRSRLTRTFTRHRPTADILPASWRRARWKRRSHVLEGGPLAREQSIKVTVNGRTYEKTVPVRLSLADFLRDHLHLTGTHIGCEHGVCGACTIMLNGRTARSCLTLAVQADDAKVITIEGLRAEDGTRHPMQQMFLENFALQCGYCTPGMLVTAIELLQDNPNPSELEVREALSGNICRCSGYQAIIDAVLEAAQQGNAAWTDWSTRSQER
jgi:xanthine dehydrogenase iron-sulfur cluster and FAD-binding subunit A